MAAELKIPSFMLTLMSAEPSKTEYLSEYIIDESCAPYFVPEPARVILGEIEALISYFSTSSFAT